MPLYNPVANVADSQLASPNNAAYKLAIPWRAADVVAATTNGTYFLLENNASLLAAATDLSPLGVVYLDPADYAVAGLTTRYRVRALLLTNGTSLGTTTLTAGLYPITASSGGGNIINMTAGTVQSGSTVPFVNPAAPSQNQANSGDFSAPAAGYYALGVVISVTTAGSSEAVVAASLQVRNT